MSGKKAKAKRKSAKKAETAAEPKSPAPRVGRLEEFILGNIRCFTDIQRVPIRPITLLVGANSTGKTTFMGGYRAIHNLILSWTMDTDNIPWGAARASSLNDEPFSMGAFHDIVNRNVRKNSTPAFQLGAKVPFRSHVLAIDSKGMPKPDKVKITDGKLDMIYSLEGVGSSAAVRRASMVFPDHQQIDIALGKRQIGGHHSMVVTDPRSGKQVDMGGFVSRTLDTTDISMALCYGVYDRQEKLPEVVKILNRHLFSNEGERRSRKSAHILGKGGRFTRNHLNFLNESVEYSFSSMRAKPKRTYDPVSDDYNPEGDHIPMFLARLSRTNEKEWETLRNRLVAFGKESGMFSDFKVKGLGKHVSDPFQIHVKAAGVLSNLPDVGFGVGQIYPLLVQIMRATQKKMRATFLLQEPEVHLHPQAQAALATFFAKSARDDGHAFIIETHGDNIIDRIRICVSNGLIPPEDVVILYFEPQSPGNVKIHPIRLDKNANLLDVPPGYRDFFIRESDLLLGFEKLPAA